MMPSSIRPPSLCPHQSRIVSFTILPSARVLSFVGGQRAEAAERQAGGAERDAQDAVSHLARLEQQKAALAASIKVVLLPCRANMPCITFLHWEDSYRGAPDCSCGEHSVQYRWFRLVQLQAAEEAALREREALQEEVDQVMAQQQEEILAWEKTTRNTDAHLVQMREDLEVSPVVAV